MLTYNSFQNLHISMITGNDSQSLNNQGAITKEKLMSQSSLKYTSLWKLCGSRPGAYSEHCETSKIELLAKLEKGSKSLITFVKHFILDAWKDSK